LGTHGEFLVEVGRMTTLGGAENSWLRSCYTVSRRRMSSIQAPGQGQRRWV